jgi:phosphoglycolate phosphatase
MRVAVFDLDGTLADTSADLIAAANGALAEAGVGARLDAARDRAVAFAGGRAMLRAGLARLGPAGAVEEAEVDRLYPRLLELYGLGLAVHTRLYDGAGAALDRLEAAGWALGLCTNKPEGLARGLIEALGLGGRFAALLGADSLPWRKPDPRHLLETIARVGGVPERAVLVGDTVTDREAARAAGIPCVLVGFDPDAAAADLAPEALIAHFDELPAVLERLLPG